MARVPPRQALFGIWLLAAQLATSACNRAQPPAYLPAHGGEAALVESFFAAFNEHDMPTMLELFSEQALYVTSSASRLRGRSQIEVYLVDLQRELDTSYRIRAMASGRGLVFVDANFHGSPGQSGRRSMTARVEVGRLSCLSETGEGCPEG